MRSVSSGGGCRRERKKTDMFDVFGLELMINVKNHQICKS